MGIAKMYAAGQDFAIAAHEAILRMQERAKRLEIGGIPGVEHLLVNCGGSCHATLLTEFAPRVDFTATINKVRFAAIIERVRAEVQFSYLALFLGGELHRLDHPEPPRQWPADDSAVGATIESGAPDYVPDISYYYGDALLRAEMAASGCASWCLVPLPGRAGAICFGSLTAEAYGDQSLGFLFNLAEDVAAALKQAPSPPLIPDDTARQRDHLSLLVEAAGKLAGPVTMAELPVRLSAALLPVARHDYMSLALHDAESNRLRMQVIDFPAGAAVRERAAFNVEGTPPGAAFTSKRPALLGEAELAVLPGARMLIGEGMRSLCCIPLGESGTLIFASARSDAFPPPLIAWLLDIGPFAAAAIRTAAALGGAVATVPDVPATVTMEAAERAAIRRALKDAGGKVGGKAGAAARLGMKRTTLQSRMEKLGIPGPTRAKAKGRR